MTEDNKLSELEQLRKRYEELKNKKEIDNEKTILRGKIFRLEHNWLTATANFIENIFFSVGRFFKSVFNNIAQKEQQHKDFPKVNKKNEIEMTVDEYSNIMP